MITLKKEMRINCIGPNGKKRITLFIQFEVNVHLKMSFKARNTKQTLTFTSNKMRKK